MKRVKWDSEKCLAFTSSLGLVNSKIPCLSRVSVLTIKIGSQQFCQTPTTPYQQTKSTEWSLTWHTDTRPRYIFLVFVQIRWSGQSWYCLRLRASVLVLTMVTMIPCFVHPCTLICSLSCAAVTLLTKYLCIKLINQCLQS